MKVELRFRETDSSEHIAYLHPAGAEDDGTTVTSSNAFQDIARGAMGVSNRSREILVVDSEAAARTVALLKRAENSCDTRINQIAADIFAVSTVSLRGEYDDGFPLMLDLREHGQPLDLQGSFDGSEQINAVIANEEVGPVVHLSDAPEMEF